MVGVTASDSYAVSSSPCSTIQRSCQPLSSLSDLSESRDRSDALAPIEHGEYSWQHHTAWSGESRLWSVAIVASKHRRRCTTQVTLTKSKRTV